MMMFVQLIKVKVQVSRFELLFHDLSQCLSIDYRGPFFALGRLLLSPGLGFSVRVVALAAGFLV